ncbi:hypothetical protein MSMTP_1856 [Methanosarcina sp. MTP4]|uniref:hypothetical protein n=1 Tax=Methanosarcina sp. MTP4 TaxID=1434100 RepID=UPI0006157EAB|nr:hypothetical protein [Methanosarcina sp. MTP4]AKB25325.1 hypothetical protein MSMTP_1856 [Methanosarcina sp. MTP4]
MDISRFSSIARPIDPNYPTNRAILILTLFVIFASAGFQVLSGIPPVKVLIPGIRTGIYVFLAWALARELDPDNELSAFTAAFLACVALLYFPVPGLLASVLFLLLIRILNRSTGLPAKSFDSLVILLLSGWLALQENWIFGATAAAAFFLDSRLSEPKRQQLFFAGAAALTSAFTLLRELKTGLWGGGVSEATPLQVTGLILILLIPAIFFVPHILASRKIKSKGDRNGLPLDPGRIQAAQVTALLGALALAALEGWHGVELFIPLWSAVIGIFLYAFLELIRARL